MVEEIEWMEWGEEAFNRAEAEDKPILLGISAVWCHWCHVMDNTTYSDPEVVERISECFVPVRVDNDQRPDINSRYNMGGWPTTAFLTPEGDVITGATYIPPAEMKTAIARVLEHFKSNRDEMSFSPEREKKLEELLLPSDSDIGYLLKEAIVDYAVLSLFRSYDPEYGGFGRAPKFPHAHALSFMLRHHERSGEGALLRMTIQTLDKMGWSGMYDSAEGGFFRYSTDREWKVPHFEKMLEDNALLLRVYLMAYQHTSQEKYAEKAADIMRYIDHNLSDPEQGAFYGSQDADEEYYSLPMEEREEKGAPYIDKTFYTDWNAAVVSSYLLASVALGDERHARAGFKALEFILENALQEERGIFSHYFNGERSEVAFLSDQAAVLKALLDAFELTQEGKYLRSAEELLTSGLDLFYDREKGAFYDIPSDSHTLGTLKYRMKPLDENARMVEVLTRLHYLTGAQRWSDLAEETMALFYASYRDQSIMASVLAGAALFLGDPPPVIHIVGDKGLQKTKDFLHSCLEIFEPRRVVRLLDPSGDEEYLSSLGYPPSREPAAYVCFPGGCEGPFREVEEVRKKINAGNS